MLSSIVLCNRAQTHNLVCVWIWKCKRESKTEKRDREREQASEWDIVIELDFCVIESVPLSKEPISVDTESSNCCSSMVWTATNSSRVVRMFYPCHASSYFIKIGTRQNINTDSSHIFNPKISSWMLWKRNLNRQQLFIYWLYAKWADIRTLTTYSLTFRPANEVKENLHIYNASFLNGPRSVKCESYRFNFSDRLNQSISLFRLVFKKKHHLKFANNSQKYICTQKLNKIRSDILPNISFVLQ